jgi:HSP20 family molecular chaperone IbpA/F0F1-type ATP synthase membrane subunit b/b'
MSVESSRSRREPQNDLSDLQSEYAKKKKKYASEQEQQLEDMKEYYNGRKEETREQGEAAINHIRKKQAESVDTVNETRRKIGERSEAQIDGIETDYRRKILETQRRRQEQLDNARENSKEKMAEIENSQHDKVEKIRAQANNDIQSVKQRYNKELHGTQEFTEKRLGTIRENNDQAVKHELENGRTVQEKLRENQKKDFETVATTGKKRIETNQQIQETKLQRQDADYAKRFERQEKQWESREKGVNETFQNRITHSKAAYEQQIKDQHERFDSVYSKNESANRDSLRIQNHNLLKEQVELKKKFFKESQQYAGKEDDPFYKLQERGNRLRENPDFYIVEAYVPEHEKDSIKINIRDDKASISGKRAFKDQIQEEGRKLSTNSYQSFREDFDFEKPVITEGMTRERHGDYVSFWIPKLNSFDGIRKLNKKA